MNPSDESRGNDPLAAQTNTVSGRILIVDDEPINLDVAARILRRAGFDTATANDGFHALKLLATESFDLVLLDIMMPDMDGFEVCSRLRQELKLDTLPVIFVTAAGDEAHVTRAFSVGANDYVIKPYRKIELIARARAAVERNVAVRRYAELQRELEKLVG
jgi:DNA-binding response OmpR family regulator